MILRVGLGFRTELDKTCRRQKKKSRSLGLPGTTEDPFHLLEANEAELAEGLCYQVRVLKTEVTVGREGPWVELGFTRRKQ